MKKVADHMTHHPDTAPGSQRERLAFNKVILIDQLRRLVYSIIAACIRDLPDQAFLSSTSGKDTKNSSPVGSNSIFRIYKSDFMSFSSDCFPAFRILTTESMKYCGFKVPKSHFLHDKNIFSNLSNI
jgi:hypothetical protein